MYIRFRDLSVVDRIMFLQHVKHHYLGHNIIEPQQGLCYSIGHVCQSWGISFKANEFMGDWWFNLACDYGINTPYSCKKCDLRLCSYCRLYEGFWWPVSDINSRVNFINFTIKYISEHV